MRPKIYALEALVLLLATKASAQPGYTTNIIGYVNVPFVSGSNLFVNPLQTDSNALSELFSNAPPDGTTVSLWDPSMLAFDTNSTFTSGSWSTNLILPPGTGALLVAPLPFTNTFVGDLLNHDGSPATNLVFTAPPVYSGSNGVFLLGDKTPLTDTGTNIFLNILGRMPFIGEKVMLLSGTSTYLGNGMWDSIPALGAGGAAFLNINSELPPRLTIVYANHQAVVSWPATTSVWTLQTNRDLATGAWVPYAGTVVNNTVTNSPPTGNLFFRLSYP